MHILSAEQFSPAQIEKIFKRADYFKKNSSTLPGRKKISTIHQGRQLASLFFQPSTRTRLSFETAAVKLGMGLISTENARENSSSTKGESIEDTFRILDGYGYDIIATRHFEVGAAARAAAVCETPIINAGDGKGEHPTQSLLDAYTIYKSHGRLQGLTVVFGGDLRYGRTVRSLSRILSKYKNNHLIFISIPELQVNDDIKGFLASSGTTFEETASVAAALKKADVVYWTRLQAEYLANPSTIPKGFTLNKRLIKNMKEDAIIMHPLPRVDEIDPDVDDDPRAAYFRQAANGLYVRMALLDLVLSEKL
ncbi:MAG: aspartate carbamoyltransferase 1, chloroplastic-like [Candidatus Saccharibacteria bacterium]|nr:aspartate carbamoyltransferase 1, chloroplastic-like [Candidatus Saccharibacteria bacterium]